MWTRAPSTTRHCRFQSRSRSKPETHPAELLRAVEGINHRTTKPCSPHTNGFVERMDRTLLGECFREAGRQTWYVEPAEIQRELDTLPG